MFIFLIVAFLLWEAPKKVRRKRKGQRRPRSGSRLIDSLSGREFELLVANLMVARGYRQVVVVGGPHDGGVDITAIHPSGLPIACQCKRWSTNVSESVVRDLIGAVHSRYRGRYPYIVTTASLSKPAFLLAKSASVRVIDRSMLAVWMRQAGY